MDLARPISTVIPSLDGQVLAVLARTTHPLTGRRVHALAGGGSETGIRKVLHRLAETGLVDAQEVGASTVYTLNREHLAAAAVLELTQLRQSLIDRLSETFRQWPTPPVHASLFGSAARGDGGLASDIDILLISPSDTAADTVAVWEDQISDLAAAAHRWTGNHVQFYEIDLDRFRQHIETREPIMDDWLRDSVTLYGPELRELRIRFVGGGQA